MGTRRARRDRARSRVPRSSFMLVTVLALAGFLFTANSQISRDHGVRPDGGLPGLVAEEAELVRELTADVDELRGEVERLTDSLESPDRPPAPDADFVAVAAGRTAVTGPGIEVTLDDAPADAPALSGIHPDELIVHQQDLEAVINALWAGGAEAMAIQGQRIVSTSAVRCVGNVLLLEGQVYSPPYVVTAVGDAAAMRAALDSAPAVATYREWADLVGLGWAVADVGSLELPAYEGGGELRFARVPEGVDVFAAGHDDGAPRPRGSVAVQTAGRDVVVVGTVR